MRVRRDGLSVQELDGEIVVLDLETSRYLTVSHSGTVLWRLLEVGTDRPAMSDALVQAYGLSRPQAEQDVDMFLAQLAEATLLDLKA